MSDPKVQVNFQFGKKKRHPLRLHIVGIILGLIVDILHRYFKVPQEQLWDLIDEIGRHFHIDDINDLVLNSSQLLERRVERDVDKAIDEYKKEVNFQEEPKIHSVFSEVKEGETPLGGELRRRGTWTFTEDNNEKTE